MVAKFQRKIKPGTEYNGLIPVASGVTKVRLRSANTNDTVAAIREVVRGTLPQTEKVAKKLAGSDLIATTRNIWEFIYNHFQYKNDEPGKEQIRTPARDWADRKTGIDCDDYSILASSLLLNLGIPHKLRVTDYGQGWQHIYVVVPKSGSLTADLDQARRDAYIVIDCVPDKYDYEVAYTRKMDTPMELHMLSGLPDDPEQELGKTIFGKIFQKVGQAASAVGKTVAKAAVAVAKTVRTVATTPIRLGILAWMKLNVKDSAQRLRFGYLPYSQVVANYGYGPAAHAKLVDSLKRLNNTFVNNLGGQANVLRMAIVTGAGNTGREVPSTVPNLSGFSALGALTVQDDSDIAVLNQLTSITAKVQAPDLKPINGLGELGEPVTASALIAAATAVMVPILNLLKGAKTNDDTDPVPDEYRPQPAAEEPDPEIVYDVAPEEEAPAPAAAPADPVDDVSGDAAAADDTPADPSLGYLGAHGFVGDLGAVKKKAVKPAAKTAAKPVTAAHKAIAAKAKTPAVKKAVAKVVAKKTATKPAAHIVKKTVPHQTTVKTTLPTVSPVVSTADVTPLTTVVPSVVAAVHAAMPNSTPAAKKAAVVKHVVAKGKAKKTAKPTAKPAAKPATTVHKVVKTASDTLKQVAPIIHLPAPKAVVQPAVDAHTDDEYIVPEVILPQQAQTVPKKVAKKVEKIAKQAKAAPHKQTKVQAAIAKAKNAVSDTVTTVVDNVVDSASAVLKSKTKPTYNPGRSGQSNPGTDPADTDPTDGSTDDSSLVVAEGGDPTPAPAPGPAKTGGLFTEITTDPTTGATVEKPKWGTIGLAAALAYVVGDLVFGGGPSPRRIASGKTTSHKVLAGTPGKSKPKSKSTGLKAVDLQ